MKKIYKFVQLSLLLLLGHTISFAQITITKNDMPSANQNFLLRGANSTTQDDYQLSGSSQTWNFTHLIPTDTQTVECLSILAIGPIAYALDFGPLSGNYAASYATKGADLPLPAQSPITVTNLYNFYKVSNSTFSILGFGASVSGFPTSVKYDTIDVVYNFPINFGDSHVNRSQFTIDIPTVGGIIESRIRTTSVEGWGTLKLPNDMDYQVLKVKTVSEIIDNVSIIFGGFPIEFAVPRNETEYKWLAAASGVPLLQINTTSALGTETVSNIALKFTPDLSGIDKKNISQISLFPNPAAQSISLKGNVSQIQISDVLGNVVFLQNVTNVKDISTLDISQLANGIYWLKNSFNGESNIQKFIVNK